MYVIGKCLGKQVLFPENFICCFLGCFACRSCYPCYFCIACWVKSSHSWNAPRPHSHLLCNFPSIPVSFCLFASTCSKAYCYLFRMTEGQKFKHWQIIVYCRKAVSRSVSNHLGTFISICFPCVINAAKFINILIATQRPQFHALTELTLRFWTWEPYSIYINNKDITLCNHFAVILLGYLRLSFHAQDGLIGLSHCERNIYPQVQEVYIKGSCTTPQNDLYLRMCVPCVRYNLYWKYHQICPCLIKEAFLETPEQQLSQLAVLVSLHLRELYHVWDFRSNTIHFIIQ